MKKGGWLEAYRIRNMVSFHAIARCYLSHMTTPESDATDSVDAAEPAPRATSRRRGVVLGVVIVALLASLVTGAVVVQQRQSSDSQNLAGFLMEDDSNPYFVAGATQTQTITTIVVQQQNAARTVRVAWSVSDADLAAQQDFWVYAIKQETYDANMSKTAEQVYGADLWDRLTATQKVAFALDKDWESASEQATIVTARNGQQLAPQKGLATYDFTLITDPGNYRFRVCAEWIAVQLVSDKPPGACSPALVYTMDRLEGS